MGAMGEELEGEGTPPLLPPSSAAPDKKQAQVGKKKQPVVFRGTLFATILQFVFFLKVSRKDRFQHFC